MKYAYTDPFANPVKNFSTNVLMLAFFLSLLFSSAVKAQTNSTIDELLRTAQQLTQTARTSGTNEAWQKVEDVLTPALQAEPKNIKALLLRGQARLEHSGLLAKLGKFEDSGKLTSQATEDYDRAVAIAPQDLGARMTRGMSYAQFPSFMNRGATAIEDLNAAAKNDQFTSLKTGSQARVFFILGKTYAAAGQTEKAAAAFSDAVKTDPQSPDGIAAKVELDKFASAPLAVDSKGARRPDRFPQLTSETSPVIVAATFTISGHKGTWSRDALPASLQTFLIGVEKQPGMLGMRIMSDTEKPEMLIILTWWQDKKALNDWFYSDTHQGLIKEYYNAGANRPAAGNTAASTTGVPSLVRSSQVGMELFTALPGGLTYGGGLTPSGAEKKPIKP